MKGKLLATLFALPFFGVGVWMLWSISSTLYDAQQMQDWVPVQAELLSAGYETSSGDDADTYRAYADYRYVYDGVRYTGSRVSISRGGDNIGDYQRDLGNRLANARARNAAITVYVSPDEPAESIVDRTVRWGLLGFKSIFVFVFGGVGLGLLIFTWRAPREKDESLPLYEQQPWLMNDNWPSATLRSSSKKSMYGAWLFAAFWNLISAPLPFLIYDEIAEKDNYIALIGLLFPLVGLGLLAYALNRTREWRRFGTTPLTLDPFPGSIGGHVGGTIDLRRPYESATRFTLTLTNVHSYESGSGEDSSRREKAHWQDAMLAQATPGPTGTRLTFRFDVPEGLHQSDIDQDDSYYLWRLNLQADLPKTKLDRSYELPVFATAQQSRLLSDRDVSEARAAQSVLNEQAIRKTLQISTGPGGRKMLFPAGRHLSASFGGFMVGLIFAAAGWWMLVEEGMLMFGGVFALVGALIALLMLYLMFNSLEVRQQGRDIVTVRRLLGIPIRTRRFARNEIQRFETASSFQTQAGGKHVMYYKVIAVARSGQRFVVGESFRGQGEAQAAIRLIASE
ncbi:MAG: DUF3592 domain-containing protein, partial [Gammaproteobacteria bacterium]|nr:DUF3592 domain-containing protein [Gammaproteobacteria bacterium]